MTAENQDIEVNAGDRVEIEDTVTDGGSAYDITNHDAQVTVAEYRGGATVIQYNESDPRFTIIDGPNGVLQAVLQSSDTDQLADDAEDDYYYEIELTDTSGNPYTVTTGEMLVKPSY